MALYYNLQVYKDLHDLAMMLTRYTKEYPREYKYTLGQDMRRDCIRLVRLIYKANSTTEKAGPLDEFMEELEVLKFEVRLSCDLHVMSMDKQAHVVQLMDSISKQIAGWRKSVAR